MRFAFHPLRRYLSLHVQCLQFFSNHNPRRQTTSMVSKCITTEATVYVETRVSAIDAIVPAIVPLLHAATFS